MGTCHYCGPTDRELRPYGPARRRPAAGGAAVNAETLLDPIVAHCFWGRCGHTEAGFDVDEVHAAMESHYGRAHRADLDALLPVIRL